MTNKRSIDWFPPRNWIGELSAGSIRKDLMAGLTGAFVVLPQGVAFAMIAGLPPIHGLYAAMVAPIVSGIFGSSKHLVSGPTVAISLVIFSAISDLAEPATAEFVRLAIIVSLVAGIIQLLLGLANMGAIVNFVSRSVIIGFTAGAAILIGTSQLQHLLGITVPRDSNFLEILFHIFSNAKEFNPLTLLVGLSAIITALLLKKLHKSIPDLLLSLIVASLVAFVFFKDHAGIPLVGKLPTGLPEFNFPAIKVAEVKRLIPNAFAIALLGLIQSVAIGRSLGTISGQRINANQEFFGQGLGNIVTALFSGYASTGSFTRSAINLSAGAKTPLSAIFAALFLMLAISFIGPLAAYLPISAIAGVIVLVSYKLIDFKYIRRLFFTSTRESSVMVITFLSVLFLELDYAIYMGILFSLILYLRQTTRPRFVEIAPDSDNSRHMFVPVKKYKLETCPQLMIYRIEGSLYFGAVDHVANGLDILLERDEKNLLIVGNNINLIDNTGAGYLVEMVEKWKSRGKQVYFSGFKFRSREFLRHGGYVEEIGEDRFFGNKEHAIEEIYEKLDRDVCKTCEVQLFRECPKRSGKV